jgi:hypothetical protein
LPEPPESGAHPLKPPERGKLDYFDAGLAGYGVRVRHGGKKSFVVLRSRR